MKHGIGARKRKITASLNDRLKIVECLENSSSGMTADEVCETIEMNDYERAMVYRIHLKHSLPTGKYALPIYVKNQPKETVPSMRKHLSIVM